MLPDMSLEESQPHKNPSDKLVTMANQIGKAFRTQGEEAAVKNTAEHIRKFWDPRMRATILAHLANGGTGLDPVARQAVAKLQPE